MSLGQIFSFELSRVNRLGPILTCLSPTYRPLLMWSLVWADAVTNMGRSQLWFVLFSGTWNQFGGLLHWIIRECPVFWTLPSLMHLLFYPKKRSYRHLHQHNLTGTWQNWRDQVQIHYLWFLEAISLWSLEKPHDSN